MHGGERTCQVLWTIGHSTRAEDDFVALLRGHGIRQLADVRLIPFSRRNPQFNQMTLEAGLRRAGISYRPFRTLGGRRKARPDSVNLGWRNASFRAYADYMQTGEFSTAVGELLVLALQAPTAVMCAEAVPWRCHRSLIADAALVRGWTVRHILSETRADEHSLTPCARLVDGGLIYPRKD